MWSGVDIPLVIIIIKSCTVFLHRGEHDRVTIFLVIVILDEYLIPII
ncbi:MAG TPA: hypothetical protein VKK79_14405 [Candidatus Lokiarchaeia archaeon]|nr:hypothetical protein [Candidatus Lokiarchaeia archaeon]